MSVASAHPAAPLTSWCPARTAWAVGGSGMKLTSRIRKVEQRLAFERDREGNHPLAPERWMQRFIAHDRRYADLYGEILSRAERLAPGTLPRPGRPMTPKMCIFGLYGQAPELISGPWMPAPEPTPDSKRAIELLILLPQYMLEYERATGDLYPAKNPEFRPMTAGQLPPSR
jgi:hypothetical protein